VLICGLPEFSVITSSWRSESMAVKHSSTATNCWNSPAARAAVEVFTPEPAPLAALTDRVRKGFDPQGVLKYAVVTADNVGRSVDETVRVLQALQTGGLCPAEWEPGKALLTIT